MNDLSAFTEVKIWLMWLRKCDLKTEKMQAFFRASCGVITVVQLRSESLLVM